MRERLNSVWNDVRYAVRTLRRAPRYVVASVFTLALGIAATTVVFSLVDHIVIRPLPFDSPERIVVVREVLNEVKSVYPTIPANASHFLEWRRRCTVCTGLAAITRSSVTLTDDGGPQRLGAVRVSWNLFSLLGVTPAIGRGFLEEEDQPGRNRVVILSDATWRHRFGGDHSVVGRIITVNGASAEVVGVLPPWADIPGGDALGALVALPDHVEVYQPLALNQNEANRTGGFDYAVLARIQKGVSLDVVRTQLDAIQRDIADRAGDGTVLSTEIVSLQAQIVGTAGRPLLLLLAAVVTVLIIVSVNLINLSLARSMERQHESAVRIALGAVAARLTRLALLESMMLAVMAGAVGLLAAHWGLRGLVALAPPDLPRLTEVRLDARVFAVGILLSALVGMIVGAVSAIRVARVSPAEILVTGGRTMTGGRALRRRRTAIIAAQVAFSTLLLVVAGLMLTSFMRVLKVDPGVDIEHVLALNVGLPSDTYPTGEHRWRFYERARAEIARVSTVSAVAVASALPLEGESWIDAIGRSEDAGTGVDQLSANFRFVSSGYFTTIGTALSSGRTFNLDDRGRRVAIVSERTAGTLWPDGSAVGRRVAAGRGGLAEVVGVAIDTRTSTLESDASLVVYLPIWEAAPAEGVIVVRTIGIADIGVAADIRTALRRVDPTVVVPKVRTMAHVVSATLAARRFQLALLMLFACLALVTASIGIYGVISQSLFGRATEIGVRMALGAPPADVLRLLMREGLTPVVLGVALGLGAALAAGRVVASLLFDVRPNDPLVLASVALLLATLGASACAIPAWRVVRCGPSTLLRSS